MKKFKLGILGVGNMGGSILEGIIKSSLYKKEEVFLYDISSNIISKYNNYNFANNEKELIENVDILIVAIKPQFFNELTKYNYNLNNLVVVSIAAGKTIHDLKNIFGNQQFIRVMPNTPALINEGATAISKGPNVNEESFNKVVKIFSKIGIVKEIPDHLMNEIIPINGSMPAFLYYFVKAFIEKAVKDGINYEVAKELACQTVIGSAKLIVSSDKSIDQLIKDVCSPKGATLEGLSVLENNHVDETLKETANATIKRAYELSKL